MITIMIIINICILMQNLIFALVLQRAEQGNYIPIMQFSCHLEYFPEASKQKQNNQMILKGKGAQCS